MKTNSFAAVLFVLFLLSSIPSLAQNSVIDSLRNRLSKDSSNTSVLIQLSKEIRRKGQHEEAKKYATKALEIGRQNGKYTVIDSALLEVAAVNYALGDLANATQYLDERVAMELKEKDSVNLAASYSYLGAYSNEEGKQVEGLQFELKAKDIADRISNAEVKYIVYATLGEYYHRTDVDKALAFRLKALEFSKQIMNKRLASIRTAEISTNVALSYVLKGNYSEAKRYLKDALEFSKNPALSLGDHLPHIYITYGYIFALEPNYDSAAFYYLKAIEYRTMRGERSRLHDSYGLLGQVYLEQGNYPNAVKYLSQAVNLSKETGALYFQYKWSPVLANAYSEMGRYKPAFDVMNEFYLLTDSVMNQEKTKAVAELETKYELKQKEQENQLLKQEGALQLQINQKQKLFLAGSVVIIVIAGVAFYFYAELNKQKNARLNERVDAQNRELTTVALLVSKKNQAFSEVKTRLEEIGKDNDHLSTKIKSVIKEIDQEMDFDEEWNTFKYHFERVHPEFFTRLKELAPSLSVTELRLCAYLRANLSTKEIARLTNTTTRSVQQAKYRINQKFPGHGEKDVATLMAKL